MGLQHSHDDNYHQDQYLDDVHLDPIKKEIKKKLEDKLEAKRLREELDEWDLGFDWRDYEK